MSPINGKMARQLLQVLLQQQSQGAISIPAPSGDQHPFVAARQADPVQLISEHVKTLPILSDQSATTGPVDDINLRFPLLSHDDTLRQAVLTLLISSLSTSTSDQSNVSPTISSFVPALSGILCTASTQQAENPSELFPIFLSGQFGVANRNALRSGSQPCFPPRIGGYGHASSAARAEPLPAAVFPRRRVHVVPSSRDGHLCHVAEGTLEDLQAMHQSLAPELFPQKLYRLVSDPRYRKTVHFTANGTQFVIRNVDKLMKIIPQYFRQNKYESFRRQLRIYGFSRRKSNAGVEFFEHPLFQRDRVDLLAQMTRPQQSAKAKHRRKEEINAG